MPETRLPAFLFVVKRHIQIAVIHHLADHRMDKLRDLRRLDQLAEFVPDLVERCQFLIAS